MTRLSCPSCRLRFGRAAAATLTTGTCPECCRLLEAVESAELTVGFRLFAPTDPRPPLPIAMEAAVPIDGVRPDRA